MKPKRVLSLLLCVMIAVMQVPAIVSAEEAAPVWDGSIDTSWYDTNPAASEYTISDGSALAGLAKLVNDGNSFEGKKIILNSNVNLNSLEWTPIGNEGSRFMGTFDGGNFETKNLRISSGVSNLGLFGYAGELFKNTANIRNLKLTGCDIQVPGANEAGAVAGYISGTVENCSASGIITGSENVGGIAGKAYTGNASGTIKNCSSHVVVSGYRCVGGVAGYMQQVDMTGCYATGNITGTGEGENKGNIGGLVGYASFGILSNCFSTGNVSGSDWAGVGGIAGRTSSITMQNCYSTGDISGSINVGGLAGYMYGSMSNCYTTGSTAAPINHGRAVGYVSEYSTVKYCYYKYIDGDPTGNVGKTDLNGITIESVSSKTEGEFAAPEMAWILNTSDGTTTNSGVWAQGITPVFAGRENHFPVYQVILNNLTSPEALYTDASGKVTLPTNPSDGMGKYFFGWYTDNGTYSKAFDQTTVVDQDTMLYANFGTRIIAISDYTAFYTGAAVEYAGNVKDNANSVPNVTDLTYTYYTDSAGTVKTTEADNGAAFEGAAPAKTGTYYIQAAAAEDTANHIDEAVSNLAKMIVTNATIASIKPVDDAEVEYGTSDMAIYYWYLASKTTITDSNGCEHTVDLDWTIDGYNENIAGLYIATGTFTLPETVIQSTPPAPLEVTAKVTVWPAVDATISPTTVVFDLDNPADVETFIDWGSACNVTDVVHGSSYLEEETDWEEDGYWEEVWRPLILISEEYLSGLGMESGDVVEFEIFFDIGDKAILRVEAVQGYTRSSDAFLGSLRVNNISVADFVYDKFNYDMKLPYGTLPYSPATIVSATPADPKTTVEIEQAYELPGVATVEVTAEDGIAKQTYTVTLTVADSPEYALAITAGSGGSITAGTSGTYEEGAVITIAAAPASGYRFNKWTSASGGTFADANSASTTFTMPANAATITATFIYKGSNSSGSSTFTPKPTYKAAVLGAGTPGTTLPVTVNKGAGSAEVDLGTLARDMFNGEEITVITVPSIPGVNAYTLGVPAASLSGSQGEGSLTFTTEVASMTVPGNMLSAIDGKKAGITIGQGDRPGLPDEIKTAIDHRPLVQLTLTVDGKQAAWNNPDAPVTVSIPYTPSAAELETPEHIVVWYIDGSGNVVSVPNGRYNPETGTVIFTTTHFSHYAVAYVAKTFDDLESVAWAKNSIEVLASKGISKGTSEREYDPRAYVTRADFLCSLVRALGVDARVDANFDDIGVNAYYHKEIAIAKKLGITVGTGNNKFNPDASITRQDMMVLTARALEMLKKLKEQGAASDLEKFADQSLISAYAIDSVAAMVKEGLIVGSGNRLNPLGNTTRAEAAVFIYRIYNKY